MDKLTLIALWPIYQTNILSRRLGLARDEMHWSDRLAIKHGSLSTEWFYG